jgi:hypothetical protein
MDNMNNALMSKGFPEMSTCAVAALKRLLLDAESIDEKEAKETEEDDGESTILCFVYGSLMSKLHNFHLMEKHQAELVCR